ncbi:restriction endonuclease [Candidatus Saccharibacteria bacterium]|nr:restriction endonuclease [Candidatus Saccharibacteria bacterium]
MILPWWCSVIASLLAYISLYWILPALLPDNPFFIAWTKALPRLAPFVAIILLIPAPFSAFNSYRKRKLLDTQSGLDSIRSLSWKQFEELVAEAYRRKGYRVRENHRGGADGGIDITLEKDGQVHLVQCKQWKSQKIGVSVIREMFGVMVSEGAASVSVITSGSFTREAENFAMGKPVNLIDGKGLAALIRDIRSILGKPSAHDVPPLAPSSGQPVISKSETCPSCGGELVTRTAKRGKFAGSQFLGCSSFPKCRFTRSV